MKLWKNSTKSIQESHQTLRGRLYCYSLVQVSFQIMTSPLATFENSLKPACLHLSCPYQISAGSTCLLLLGVKPVLLWALCHGTTLSTSQLILMEGKIRPANWSYHSNPQRCHLPTFGAFYIGRQIANADKDIPSWAEQELLYSMEKKGKGQQEITVGAMYRGARDHLAPKAGGNEKGQLNVAKKGIVTTPEKYTIAHSHHVGLKFIAIKWADLKGADKSPRRPIELRDTDSEDNVNYRANEERRAARHRG